MTLNIASTENKIVKNSNLRVVLNNFVIDEIFERYTLTELYDFDNFDIIAKKIFDFIENVTKEFYNDLLEEKDMINFCLIKSIFGFGIIEQLIDDNQISEIRIKGTEPIHIKKSEEILTAVDKNGDVVRFSSIEELMWITKKLLIATGKVVSADKNELNQILPDGTEVDLVFDGDKTKLSLKKRH
jgi:Flp pilus assembly CpaF family ATPase